MTLVKLHLFYLLRYPLLYTLFTLSIIFRSKLKFGSNIEPKRASFPNEAKIVIVGGGAQGMAIAYKLAKLKYGKDIVVLDQVYYNRSQYFYIFINILYV